MSKYSELKKILLEKSTFLITTHVNPDADAIGSEIALAEILYKLGKEYKIINYSETPYYLQFLDVRNEIEKYDYNKHKEYIKNVEVFIALDFNRLNRTIKMESVLKESQSIKICIDHHQDPENFASYYFNGTDYCATGHLLYNFIKETQIVDFDYSIALPLYAAIMTDTGSFRFDRTSSEVHQIVSHLLKLGVVPIQVHSEIYDQNKLGKLHLLGKSLLSIKLFGDNDELAVMVIKNEDFDKYETSENDTEGFINIMMSIKSVNVALKFLEVTEGFKVSLRSKGDIPVHQLAQEFGGGGHLNASGIRIRDKVIEDCYQVIVNRALTYAKGEKL